MMDYYYDLQRVHEDFRRTMLISDDVEEMIAQYEKLMMFNWISGY